MADPQDHKALQIALFTMNKIIKQIIVPQEAESLRCMVLIHIIKINTLKVK